MLQVNLLILLTVMVTLILLFATSASAPVFLLGQNATLQFEGATSDGAQTILTLVDPTEIELLHYQTQLEQY